MQNETLYRLTAMSNVMVSKVTKSVSTLISAVSVPLAAVLLRSATRISLFVATCALLLVLHACSSEPQSGISGSGAPVLVANGPISGFGSVIVNGVRFDTDSTEIYVNGNNANEQALKPGHVITVSSGNSAVNSEADFSAEVLHLDHDVQGPISQIDTVNRSIEVLGQRVIILPDTKINLQNPDGFVSMQAGQFVQISGFRNSSGEIEASRVDEVTIAHGIVTGELSELDVANRLFSVGGAQFMVAPDNSTIDLSTVQNGTLVQVFTDLPTDANPMVVSSFRQLTVSSRAANGQQLIGRGNVESITIEGNRAQLTTSGLQAVIDESTVFVNGQLADVVVDSRLKFSGLVFNDQLLINKLEFTPRATKTLESITSNIVVTSNDPIYQGYIKFNDQTEVQVNSLTEFIDHSQLAHRQFNLAHVRSGDSLIVGYYVDSGGRFIATLIDRIATPEF